MRHVTPLALVAALLMLTGCGGGANTPEGVADEMVDIMEEMVTILEGVKDESSAKAAADKINSLSAKGEALGKKMEEVMPKDPEKAMEVAMKMLAKMAEVGPKLEAESKRIMNDPALAKHLEDALKKVK